MQVANAPSPEELESLFEDALLIRDAGALAALFEEGAVLVMGQEAALRGEGMTELALTLWAGDHAYVAHPLRVIQARDIALIVTEQGINVARRGSDGAWRYLIVHTLSLSHSRGRKT